MDVAGRIHEANQRFMEAISAADSATMPSLYTSDAKILPPNADAVSGADAIVEYWQAFFDLGIAAAQPETLEVIPMGGYALEVGEYSLYGDDETLADRGKIMVLWKNEDGTWKMHRDTWNSSLPPQGA
jgi:ketosteroid isomerase-like protein